MPQIPPADIRRNLPSGQQFTQRLVDQFNADERQWQDARKRIEPVGESLRKRKRKPKRISAVHQDSVHSLATGIAELIRGYEPIFRQAKALGIFTNDRELLECPACGLKEDVLITGRLATYRGNDFDTDTGLCFKDLGKGRFRCPSCKSIVKEASNG